MDGETGGDEGECVPENEPIELEGCSTLQSIMDPNAPCGPCYAECHTTYWCYEADGSQPVGGCPICAENQAAANAICQSDDFIDDPGAYAEEQPCYLPLSCTGWNPAGEITEVSAGNFEVDQDFLDTIVADPTLLKCDTARFDYDAGAQAFEISGVSTGGFFSELGFMNGDIVLEINSYPVQSAAQVAFAFGLFYVTQPSSYTIEVDRSSTSTFLYVTVN